jgi:hypothetical protein
MEGRFMPEDNRRLLRRRTARRCPPPSEFFLRDVLKRERLRRDHRRIPRNARRVFTKVPRKERAMSRRAASSGHDEPAHAKNPHHRALAIAMTRSIALHVGLRRSRSAA